ncbi:MAG: DUF5049 domain-containing protein [Synergistaceae bacterium]|nr:DUF5049 domain-containing protein [Synergistaceae bacterium]
MVQDDEIIIEQILQIRDTGLTNMFNSRAVQCLAFKRGFHELVCFIEEHPAEYFERILHGMPKMR